MIVIKYNLLHCPSPLSADTKLNTCITTCPCTVLWCLSFSMSLSTRNNILLTYTTISSTPCPALSYTEPNNPILTSDSKVIPTSGIIPTLSTTCCAIESELKLYCHNVVIYNCLRPSYLVRGKKTVTLFGTPSITSSATRWWRAFPLARVLSSIATIVFCTVQYAHIYTWWNYMKDRRGRSKTKWWPYMCYLLSLDSTDRGRNHGRWIVLGWRQILFLASFSYHAGSIVQGDGGARTTFLASFSCHTGCVVHGDDGARTSTFLASSCHAGCARRPWRRQRKV